MSILTGRHLFGDQDVADEAGRFWAADPVTGQQLEPFFAEGDVTIVAAAVVLAAAAFDQYRHCALELRAKFLETIAQELQESKAVLLERAGQETGLPAARLEGELGRTVNQLRLFADLVRDGSFRRVRIESAMPDRTPVPKPDLRLSQVALGPVAIFGASNFPLAFSVAGGDTASALAAGCTVVVKGHQAHPGTSELAGQAIRRAVKVCGLPTGVFSLVQGSGHAVGSALVQQPAIKAVAFTGSHVGGRALYDLAVARQEPVPVFAEMGSVNPVFLLPKALAIKTESLATAYVASVNLGVGQFCTNPGLLFALKGPELESFVRAVAAQFDQIAPAPLLHTGLKQGYLQRLEAVTSLSAVSMVTVPQQLHATCYVSPVLLKTDQKTFLREAQLGEEIFGPASIIVECDTIADLHNAARELKGQLTATVHAEPAETAECRQLFAILETKAGRLVLNDFPTGVEVCGAMNHGGPYPATTDSRTTSVGTAAIERFLRPVCYQGFSAALLPEELQD